MENQNFDNDIEGLAGEVEGRVPEKIVEGPKTAQNKHVTWAIGGVLALFIGIVQAGVLMGVGESVGAPAPPPALLAEIAADDCVARMDSILDAIDDYKHEHGHPPMNLAALRPEYLDQAPVDPASGSPYRYAHNGEGVSLNCPNPGLHEAGGVSGS